MDNEKIHHIEKKLYVHEDKIKCLEDFKEEHIEGHQELFIQLKINTTKIDYVVKGLTSVLWILISGIIISLLNLVIKTV